MSSDEAANEAAITERDIRFALLTEFRRLRREQPFTNQILTLDFRRFVVGHRLPPGGVIVVMQDLLDEGLLAPQAVTLTDSAVSGRAKITQLGLEEWARLDGVDGASHSVADWACVESAASGNGASDENDARLFTHSDDYRSITWRGQRYLLTVRQAELVQCLNRERQAGRPEVSTTTIAGQLATGGGNIRGIFRGRNRALGGVDTLVEVVPGQKGFYRLNL